MPLIALPPPDDDVQPEEAPEPDYWAAQKPETLGNTLVTRNRQWRDAMQSLFRRVQVNWRMYYGVDGKAAWHENLYQDGDLGEIVALRVNVARDLVQHVQVNTTSTNPAIEPMAKNTDGKSTKQIAVCKSIANEYMDSRGGFVVANRATEWAQVLDWSCVHATWDRSAGDLVEVDMEGQPVLSGDPKFSVLSRLDVISDPSARSFEDTPCFIVREFANRWDLIAQYPDQAEAIKAMKPRYNADAELVADLPSPSAAFQIDHSDTVEFWTFYHRKTPAIPKGRRAKFLPDGTWLEDEPLVYKDVPLYALCPWEVMGSSFGYGPVTTIGSSQEALTKMTTTAATTLFTHGVSNIIVAKGSNLDVSSVSGGNNIFEVDAGASGDVTKQVAPLQLTALPPEVMNFATWLTGSMEQSLGLNKIVRGDPGSVNAGVAVSLFQAMAQQFQGPLEKARAAAIKFMVLFTWESLRIYNQNAKRFVQLVGKSQRQSLQEFTGSELEGFERVDVNLGNPLSRTPAGRIQIAQMLKQDGQPLPPTTIMDIINTGSIDVKIEGAAAEEEFIRAENDLLREGKPVAVMQGQDHRLHIFGHSTEQFDTEVLNDPSRKQALDQHIAQHAEMYATGDVAFMIRSGMLPPGFANPMFSMGPPGAQPSVGVSVSRSAPPPAGPPGPNDQQEPPMKPPDIPGASPQQ